MELRDATLVPVPPRAAQPCSLPSTISARPARSSAPSRIYAEEGRSQFLTSCPQPQKIAHPESVTFATIPFPPSSQCNCRKEGRVDWDGISVSRETCYKGGRRYRRQLSRQPQILEAQDLPVDGLGLLRIPPESYSCSRHPDGKTRVHAHESASEEIPVEASNSTSEPRGYIFINF